MCMSVEFDKILENRVSAIYSHCPGYLVTDIVNAEQLGVKKRNKKIQC